MTHQLSVASIVLNDFRHDSRVRKEARSLQTAGYDVTVVAMHDDALPTHESVDNFQVHRLKLSSKNWSKNLIVQLLKYLEFVSRAVWAHGRNDVIHCHDLSGLPVGVLAKLLLNRRAKVIYDAHEHETEIAELTGIQKTGTKILERLLIKRADAVITVSDLIAKDYQKLYGIPKPHLVLNAPELSDVPDSDVLRRNLGIAPERKIFLYQGALSPNRGIELLLETAATETDDNIAFVFMGYGILEDKIREQMATGNNVFLQPAVPMAEIIEYSRSADVGFSLIEDKSLSLRYSLPNKLFEYVMASRPVICSNLPEMRQFVEQYQVGVVALDATPSGIRAAMHEALALDPVTLNGKLAIARQTFNWAEQEKVLRKIYADL